ncbi:unnamed protein product [Hydatigera taeniaeformis]|uniref:Zinc_ribbon_16 domain-containing protein n=1 Tax=Hydatigena taeniaeformis TaxID=6205 RepID=A0A0R3X4U0_HYDTA|nr:unnamed protein product [Hydatigera taeniaeformis]
MRGRAGITSLRCQGALAILCGDEPMASEAIDRADWQGIDAHLPFPRYSSSKRSRVLRMCMWPLDAPADVQRRVFESVWSDQEFERAAAMALINLQFDWALSFLSRASECKQFAFLEESFLTDRRTKEVESGLEQMVGASTASTTATALTASETDLIGLALSGFSDSRNHLWPNACADVLGRLHNPYLRLMFKFLTVARGDFSTDVDFTEILQNDSLFLIDRLAFACLYLNDDKLREYVLSTFHRMLDEGRLEAVLLTGLSSSYFFDLLQCYVDLTFDVQTAAILGLHACYLCRRAAPPISAVTTTATTLTTSTPAANRVVGAGQSRLRFRGLRNGADRSSLPPAAGPTSPPSPSADKVVASLGGRRLANWVETYRDMLDRWRMWFYRVDFDNYYTTRLVTPFFCAGVQSRAGGSAVSSTLSSSMSKDTSFQSAVKLLPPVTPVRGIGLPAATSQIFASCIYCGWRLGGVVRGTVEEPTSTSVPPPATNPTAATVVAVTAVASGASAGTSMHAGGGKQTICWHCLKPLPRCSICLMHMGSEVGELDEVKVKSSRKQSTAPAASETATSPTKGSLSDATGVASLEASAGATMLETVICSKTSEWKKSTKMSIPLSKKQEVVGGNDDASRGGPLRLASWFVWCQACRHGGHANHIFDWFYGGSGDGGNTLSPNLIECPVNGCFCHCASLDSSVPQPRFTPPSPTTVSTAGGAASGDGPTRNIATMLATMRDLTLNPVPSTLSSSSSSLTSPALASMDASPHVEDVGGKLLRRSPVTPASVPKNRREIVDPVVLAVTDSEEGEEAIEADN